MPKTFIIGDIHGCYDEFIQLTEKMNVAHEDTLVSLGDIVDRGNKSLEVYEYFRSRPNSIVLMGNHERKHLKGILSYSQEIVKVQFGKKYSEFLEWLETLPYHYETDDALIVHAFFEHDQLLENQKEEVLAGTTSGSRYLEGKYPEGTYWSDYYSGAKPIIYGHHVVGDSPKIKNNTYGIDTGGCHGGMLTALELPGFRVHQVPVETDYWKEEQIKWQIPVLDAKDWENMKMDQVQKLIDKLSYKAEKDVQAFLSEIKTWIEKIDSLVDEVKTSLSALALKLKEAYQDQFNQEVAKLPYRTFVFKALHNNLETADLRKTFDTPQKINDLAKELNLSPAERKRATN